MLLGFDGASLPRQPNEIEQPLTCQLDLIDTNLIRGWKYLFPPVPC